MDICWMHRSLYQERASCSSGSSNQGPSQKLHLNLPKSSPYPGLQLLKLFLPSLQCQLLGLIQTVGTGVLLLLQLFCHHGCLVVVTVVLQISPSQQFWVPEKNPSVTLDELLPKN
ncbi:hypothetical protein DV515_00010039 [Chloebia gouldiae]|uniref:Uncharacterized protein n=1 Tax=Chloebia gouldiae TaxID=44316 RepID=A0A3L8SAU2_CHLGU|nr:hypothetical protein DV515_00010039 [Chloebia gouldiae]